MAIVEQLRLFRESICSLLCTLEEDFLFTGSFSNIREFQRHLNSGVPQLVIVSIHLPGASDLEILKQVSTSYPDLRIVFMYDHLSPTSKLEFANSGVCSLLNKECSKEEFATAVNEALRGQCDNGGKIDNLSKRHTRNSESLSDKPLSEQELNVLKFLAEGLSYKQIGLQLNISVNTVKDHLKRIRKKTGIHSKGALVRLAMKLGL